MSACVARLTFDMMAVTPRTCPTEDTRKRGKKCTSYAQAQVVEHLFSRRASSTRATSGSYSTHARIKDLVVSDLDHKTKYHLFMLWQGAGLKGEGRCQPAAEPAACSRKSLSSLQLSQRCFRLCQYTCGYRPAMAVLWLCTSDLIIACAAWPNWSMTKEQNKTQQSNQFHPPLSWPRFFGWFVCWFVCLLVCSFVCLFVHVFVCVFQYIYWNYVQAAIIKALLSCPL